MSMSSPIRLTTESLVAPLAVATSRPRFGWWVPGHSEGTRQTAYELEVTDALSDKVLTATGKVVSDTSNLVEISDLKLPGRSAYRWRVRIWTNRSSEAPSSWAEASFGTGMLDMADWQAPWIEPEQKPVTREPEIDARASATGDYPKVPADLRLHPCPILRQRFTVGELPKLARLYITAHGLFEVLLNGRPVTEDIFAPGYDAHPQRLSVHCYDLSGLLVSGENIVGITLADGWWAGRTSFSGASCNYGDRLGVTWQIEGDRQIMAASSRDAVSAVGPTRYSDIFIGEKHDAREDIPGWAELGFNDAKWTPVSEAGRDIDGLVPFIGEPVRRLQMLRPKAVLKTPAGETVIDLGQNIAGRLKLRARGPAGTTITLVHSEVLDARGNFRANIMGRNKDQTDVWILAGRNEAELYEPRFTFHGFRYVKVTGWPGDLTVDDIEGVVIGSDLIRTGHFETDNTRINRLYENVVWSLKANFLSIPTDCPQRERAGWTGDIQVFAAAASGIFNVLPFLTRWLANVRAAQKPNGQIPLIVPNTPSFVRMMPFAQDSAAGWSDAIALIPLVLHERYGDRRVLEENFSAMQAWHGWVRATAANGVPERYAAEPEGSKVRERQRFLWNTGFQFGDWLAPSTITDDPMSMFAAARLTGELVGSAFYYRTTRAVEQAATLLGDHMVAHELNTLAQRIEWAFAEEYIGADGRITPHIQGAYVLALAFGLVPRDLRDRCAAQLVDLIEAANCHLDTGFLSLPHLLPVLVDIGRKDLAYRILMQDSAPSWLYQVDRGATTIWEEWRAIDGQGNPHNTSFNHYAFGAVADWLMTQVAGIRPKADSYRKAMASPDREAPFRVTHASLDGPFGPISNGLGRE